MPPASWCSITLTQQRTSAVGAHMRLRLGSFLSCLVEANFWCSTGAGASSFGRSVRWKNIVHSRQSPVSQAIYELGYWLEEWERDAAEVVDRLEKMQKDVLALYQKGEASINDINEEGKNHLQYFVRLLIRLRVYELLTSEVVSVVMPMVQLYVEMGLTCDERDRFFIYTSINHSPDSLPFVITSTTLAGSAQLLLPYDGRVIDANVKLVSLIARASDPLIDDVTGVMPYVDPGLFFTQVLDYETCLGNIPPLVRAILVRSLDDLKSAIRLSPKSLLAKTHGLTVLHLSIGWPPGLSLLLDTDARLLLDTPDNNLVDGFPHLSWPFTYAAARGCAQSLDLVLQAGCDLNPPNPYSNLMFQALSRALETTSATCVEVFVRHMARRRGDFFALASSNLDKIIVHLSGQGHAARKAVLTAIGRLPDQEPAGFNTGELVPQISEQSVCDVLTLCFELANIPIPRSLRHIALNIYHLLMLPLAFFPIFERHGFAGYNEADQHGLRPVMNVLRNTVNFPGAVFAKVVLDVLPWLIEHGCLDARPVHMEKQLQPNSKVTKIHIGATGWHYISMKMVTATWPWFQDWPSSTISVASTNLLATIAEGEASCHRDGCVCWCTLPLANGRVGEQQSRGGCSPFSFMCKLYLEGEHPGRARRHNFCHHLFRHKRNGDTSVSDTCSTLDDAGNLAATTPVPTWQLEVLRLLTFEALEMTHTCCRTGPLHNPYDRAIFSHPDPEEARQRLSADPAEADKAPLLEKLMAEFTEQLERKACTPQDLEHFIFGSWRARITGLYNVNDQELKAIEGFLGGRVRTRWELDSKNLLELLEEATSGIALSEVVDDDENSQSNIDELLNEDEKFLGDIPGDESVEELSIKLEEENLFEDHLGQNAEFLAVFLETEPGVLGEDDADLFVADAYAINTIEGSTCER
ncbi:hypothetical protein Daus18300_006327 [Diaporthe australafricana]|uniref:Uncharacterized protein n=1 Tax=Diaporthe australafricana TaxID=127596 RepID=A0ABR3WUY5_9PEZI